MIAAELLARRQREWPVGPAGDRAPALLARLKPLHAPELEQKRLSGALLTGEIGRPIPNATTIHCADGSHAVLFYSGLIDFLNEASTILTRGTNFHTGARMDEAAADDMGGVVSHLTALFERWKPEGLAAAQSAPPAPRLPPEIASDAWLLGEAGLLFVLSHELGHVLLYKPPDDDDDTAAPQTLTREQEFAADATGMRNLISAAAGPGYARMRLAGVVITLRTLAVLSSLGHEFRGDHPSPTDRLNAIFDSARRFCKTERDFWSLSPIAFSYDEMLDVAGKQARKESGRPPLTAARMFSRLSAVLEHCIRSGAPPSIVIGVMTPDLSYASPEILRDVAETAARMFPPVPVTTESPTQDQLWAAKARLFASLDDEWPERGKIAFREASENSTPGA